MQPYPCCLGSIRNYGTATKSSDVNDGTATGIGSTATSSLAAPVGSLEVTSELKCHLVMTILDRGGIADSHHSTGGIIENVFHVLDIGLWVRLVLEGDRRIEDGFLTGLDLARSIQGGLGNPWLG